MLKIEILLKIKILPSNSTPGDISKKTKTLVQRNTCTPVFIVALFTIAKIGKQPSVYPTHEWIKIWGVCVCVCVCHTHTHTQWNTTQPLQIMKFCHLQQYGLSWGY